MSNAVFCIAKSTNHAASIVGSLKSAGFTSNSISILYPDQMGAHDLSHEKGSKAPEGAATGAGTGGVVGGALGWLAGIGTLAIPGLGPFIAAGPIMAALSGAAVGATFGGIAGGLIGMGIPEYEAKLFEEKLRAGKTLISVHTDDREELDRAKDVFTNAAAEDIGVSAEKSVKE